VNKNDIWAICQKRLGRADFERILQKLQDDGAIFTTTDNETYSITY